MASTTASKKVFISVDPENVQQECVSQSRRTLKVLQPAATDKENLAGRGQHALLKQKLDLSTPVTSQKKAKQINEETQTDFPVEEKQKGDITEEDLTTEKKSEFYWERLAEQRRLALDSSLRENEKLHERVQILEEELKVSDEMLKETKNLVEVLTEMLQEQEEANDDDQTEN